MENLDKWCRSNWNKVDPDKRKACLDHLRGWIPDDILTEWKTEGFGGDFHMFGGGMAVRNRLRDIMKDDELPPVAYPGGPSHNWDDYYTGALAELMEGM